MTIKPTYMKTLCILSSSQAKFCDMLESLQTTCKILYTAQFKDIEKVKKLLNVCECQLYIIDLIQNNLQELTEFLKAKIPK